MLPVARETLSEISEAYSFKDCLSPSPKFFLEPTLSFRVVNAVLPFRVKHITTSSVFRLCDNITCGSFGMSLKDGARCPNEFILRCGGSAVGP